MTPAAGYTEMKDSGIPWIGEIPSHWGLGKVKNCFFPTRTIVGNAVENYDRLALTLSGVIKRSKTDDVGLQPERFETYQILRENELVFKLIDLQNVSTSRVGRSRYVGIVSPAYIILRNKQNKSTKYAEYFFLAMWMHQIFNQLGADGVRSNIGTSSLLNLPFPLVPDSEQSAIAAYLDTQCTKIDEIIAEAKASIEDYKQWKASIIYEAVTKGLDPNAEMKDSGISSFGKIPAHWEIYRFQILCKLRSEDNSGGRELLSVYLDRGVIKYSDSSGMQVHKPSDSLEKYQNVYVNDFVMNNQQAWRGSVGVSKYNGIVSPAYHVYELSEDCFPQYMSYLLRDSSMVQQYELASRGVGTIQRNIYEPWLRKSYIALPTLAEQAAIAAYLDAKCAKIDMLVKEKQGFIIDLEAYKKSLIYEVVTGKRRVC